MSYLVSTLFFLLITYLLHAAESFLRSYSKNSPHFTEPESLLLHSKVPPNCPYPEPDRSRASVNILNKGQRTADNGWSSSLGFGRGAKNSSPYKRIVLQIIQKRLGPGLCFFIIEIKVFFLVK
jgi:hypothetical protein